VDIVFNEPLQLYGSIESHVLEKISNKYRPVVESFHINQDNWYINRSIGEIDHFFPPADSINYNNTDTTKISNNNSLVKSAMKIASGVHRPFCLGDIKDMDLMDVHSNINKRSSDRMISDIKMLL